MKLKEVSLQYNLCHSHLKQDNYGLYMLLCGGETRK